MATTAFLQKAYLAYFGRPVDFTGTTAFANSTELQVQNAFSASAESQALYGSTFGAAQINAIYLVLFGRAAEPAGLAYWSNQVQLGLLTPAGAAVGILNGALNADAIAVTNKLDASAKFTIGLDTTAKILGYSGNVAAASARDFLATVTATPVTPAQVDSGVSVAVVAGTANTNAGTTFTLTNGVDNLVGTVGNDIFIGDNTGGAANRSVSAADQINGGAGIDTFNYYVLNTAVIPTIPVAQLNSVENINLIGATAAAITANFTSAVGLQQVALKDTTTGGSTITLGAGVAAGLDNVKSAGNAETFVFTATQTAAGVNVVNGTNMGTLNLDGALVTTLNVVSAAGAANTIGELASTGVETTLNISGAGNLTINAVGSTLTTINAATATSSVSVNAAAVTSTALKFTGGSGNDTLKLGAGQLVKTMTLIGGAGVDTLSIADATVSSTTTGLNQGINAVTGFEILAFSSAAATAVDLSQVTAFTQFSLAGSNNTAGAAGVAGAVGSSGTAGAVGSTGTNSSGVAVALTGETNTQFIIVDAGITATGGAGGAGGAGFGATTVSAGGAGGAGGNGASALTFAPLVDNGSNVATLTLNGVTLNSSGGVGGVGGSAVATVANGAGGSGGNGAVTVDASNFETFNIVSNANTAGTVTANVFNAAGGASGAAGTGAGTPGSTTGVGPGSTAAGLAINTNGTVNISGAASLNAGLISGTNITVNASTLTGALTLSTGSGNDVIIGGSGVNTITLTGGADTVDLTKSVAKADVINVVATGTTSGNFIKIAGFTNAASTGDRLDISGVAYTALAGNGAVVDLGGSVAGLLGAQSSTGVLTFSGAGAATATLANKVAAAFSASFLNNTAKELVFEHAGNTYVAVETGTAGGVNPVGFNAGSDMIIELTGVTGVVGISAFGASGAASAANVVLVG